MVKVGMRIRHKHPFNSGGQAQISQFAFLFVVAFLSSLLIFPRVSPQSQEELKDRALVQKFALTPVYWDEQGVAPMYGTIKVEFFVKGTMTKNEEFIETTTTYDANASWTLQYDAGGVTETKTLSGTGNVVIVNRGPDPPTRTTSKTTYSLDPSDAVSMKTYGPEGEGEFGVTASKKQKCCYFGIGLWEQIKVRSHLEGADYDGHTYSYDNDQTWHVSIPSHWQGLAECIAAHKNCPSGIVEGSFTDGKTSGSYSAPVFFTEGGALWEPELRALGEPVDGSGLPYVQGTVTVSWNLGGKPQDVEAVIIPFPGFEGWIPEGGKDEDTEGGFPFVVDVKLRLKNKPGKETSEKAKFKFELIDTSKEPGLCLNAPKKDKAKRSFDLKFRQDANPDLKVSNEDQTAQSKEYQESETVVISSYDGGAYGKLRVTATLASGEQVIAHVDGKPQQEMLVIPCDENDNRVADEWEKQAGVFDKKLPANWDGAEEPKGQKAPGDGISLYEKYRGFEFEGIHERLDPNQKYLFVHDPDEIVRRINSESPQTVITVGDVVITNEIVRATRFSAVSKLRLRYVDDDHWTGSGSSNEKKRIVNFNTGWKEGHAVDQHALDVVIDQTNGQAFPVGYQDARQRAGKVAFQQVPVEEGFTYPDIDYRFGSPTHTYRIVILLGVIFADILEDAMLELKGTLWSGDPLSLGDDPAAKERIIKYLKARSRELGERLVKQEALVLSHEMSHGVGVQHHDDDSGKEECVMTLIKPKAKGGADDPYRLKTYKPWPHELCADVCWKQVIVSDLADKKAGK
jgi:hypothetical protein